MASTIQAGLQRVNSRRRSVLNPEFRKRINTIGRQGCRVVADMVIRVAPSGDTAIASYQIGVRTRHAAGKITDEHAFETDVWFKRGGSWKVAHVHYSRKPDK